MSGEVGHRKTHQRPGGRRGPRPPDRHRNALQANRRNHRPEEFAKFYVAEAAKWAKVVNAIGLSQ
jgi:hypothetical protein